MHNFTRHIFDSLPKKDKLNYIDGLIDKKLDLNKAEFEFATKAQKDKYIKNKFTTRRGFKPFEVKHMKFDELQKFVQRNRNLIDYEILSNLEPKNKEKIIAQIADSKFLLSLEKFSQLTHTEKKIYAKARLDKFLLIPNYVLKYLDVDDQKKFIDDSIENGISFSQEMLDVLKAPAKKYYEKSKITNLIQERVRLRFIGKN